MRRFEEIINELFNQERKQKGRNPGFMRGSRSRRLSHHQCKLVPVEKGDKLVGGRKSKRVRQNKWVRT